MPSFKTITTGAIPVMAGVMAVALLVRYFGNKPVISDVAKGLKGEVNALI